MNIVHKFQQGLKKSSAYLTNNLINILKQNKINDESIETIESVLISADISLDVTTQLVDKIRFFSNNNDNNQILTLIASEISAILKNREKEIFYSKENWPHISMFVGVNGCGKTTTIGKLIYKLKDNNKILVAACDTFRAAAIEQLKEWSNKYNVDFFEGNLNQDPASVAFKACEKAKNEKHDYVFIDTAGRLSNNVNLINQLIKIKDVIKKSNNNKDISNILVLDGTNGSNMITQVDTFNKAIDISGLIITKLDGTAKGGAVISIAKKYQIPIHFIGLGEKEEDLLKFDAQTFSNSLFSLDS